MLPPWSPSHTGVRQAAPEGLEGETADMAFPSKYAGKCTKCGERFPAGTVVNWRKGEGAWHADPCTDEAVAAAPAAAAGSQAAPQTSQASGGTSPNLAAWLASYVPIEGEGWLTIDGISVEVDF